MRVATPGIRREAPRPTFLFEDREIAASPGETLAAALIAAGETIFRRTREDEPRGPVCGMGVCFDCLVTVDGETARACLTSAKPGLVVRRHHPTERAPPVPVASLPRNLDLASKADVVVVGAGPAGLSAAAVAARAGLSVLVLDERKSPGGQYYKQPAEAFSIDETKLDRQFRAGRALAREAETAGARFITGAAVFGTSDRDDILVDIGGAARRVAFRRLVLATGAAERGVPFPGWTLPGVMTTGAAQTFLRSSQVAPPGRIVIAGNGPLNLQLAAELVGAGARVTTLIETARAPGPWHAREIATMFATNADLVRDGLVYQARAAKAGVRPLHGRTVIEAMGTDRVEAVLVAPLDRQGRPDRRKAERIPCDALCLGHGFLPGIELARAFGCAEVYDPRWRFFALERDEDARTSVETIFAPGDGGGFGGARVALAQGFVAGAVIAADLGAALHPADATALADKRADLDRQRRFQAALWSLYRAPVLVDQLATPDTIVCRCEEVRLAHLDRALSGGAGTLGAVKRETRLGMGRCQGRACVPVAVERLAGVTGRAPEPGDGFAPRAPARPVTVGALAGMNSAIDTAP